LENPEKSFENPLAHWQIAHTTAISQDCGSCGAAGVGTTAGIVPLSETCATGGGGGGGPVGSG